MTPATTHRPMPEFLPMGRAEMRELGWDVVDVLLITGDAYVDHPSFGAALLGRWLTARGFRVGIVAQPRWDSAEDVARLGRPRLCAGVTAGALDSMLAHYTAFRKKRGDDAYTPGGCAGARPNRACVVYAGLVRQAFSGLPVILGGIEASMRRSAHYDFWTDSIRRSVLLDSKADLLIYGMAERALLDAVKRLDRQADAPLRTTRDALRGIPGTVWWESDASVSIGTSNVGRPLAAEHRAQARFLQPEPAQLPSFEEIRADPRRLMEATLKIERQVHQGGPRLSQASDNRRIVIEPPAEPLHSGELDALYELPFTYRAHPSYREPVPAEEMIRFSITTHRGCGGGCSFCSLALHQGRGIQSRGADSIVAEAERMTRSPMWRGNLSDAGGPTANMWDARCAGDPARCSRVSCLVPAICPNFKTNQRGLVALLRRLAAVPGVKHVRSASGIRHDLALQSNDYVRALVADFVGGQLKLAPEHSAARVLELMRKPAFVEFERFLGVFDAECVRAGKEQYVAPYLISAFPGCTDGDMRELAAWLRARHWTPQQVQCFIPTPGTVATAMFAGRINPAGHVIHVARTDAERLRQHGILVPTAGKPSGKRKNQSGTQESRKHGLGRL